MTGAEVVGARSAPTGEQTVDVVVDHGYRPHTIVARAGTPLRLVFHRQDPDECMDRVVFSSPRIDRRLARGMITTIVLPAQPPGEIRFTCGMGRYHGQIRLEPERSLRLAKIKEALGRRLHAIRDSVWPSRRGRIAEEALAIVQARFAGGEISEEEYERARDLALADDREYAP